MTRTKCILFRIRKHKLTETNSMLRDWYSGEQILKFYCFVQPRTKVRNDVGSTAESFRGNSLKNQQKATCVQDKGEILGRSPLFWTTIIINFRRCASPIRLYTDHITQHLFISPEIFRNRTIHPFQTYNTWSLLEDEDPMSKVDDKDYFR